MITPVCFNVINYDIKYFYSEECRVSVRASAAVNLAMLCFLAMFYSRTSQWVRASPVTATAAENLTTALMSLNFRCIVWMAGLLMATTWAHGSILPYITSSGGWCLCWKAVGDIFLAHFCSFSGQVDYCIFNYCTSVYWIIITVICMQKYT